MDEQIIYGFHAVSVRLKAYPDAVLEVHVDASRRDARMQKFLLRAQQAGVRLLQTNASQLTALAGTPRHQGVVARVRGIQTARDWQKLLDGVQGPPLLLLLDGVTDPHNLGACLRVADGAGVHAVIAPKDHAAGISPVVAKVASGAADTVPYFMVTNLARTMKELKDRGIWLYGASDAVSTSLYETDLTGPAALVLGAEGHGLRRLTQENCDVLLRIPMQGAVSSLNVSVASGVCLYEAVRQRQLT